jgi:hypothetical protein
LTKVLPCFLFPQISTKKISVGEDAYFWDHAAHAVIIEQGLLLVPFRRLAALAWTPQSVFRPQGVPVLLLQPLRLEQGLRPVRVLLQEPVSQGVAGDVRRCPDTVFHRASI